MTVDAFKGPVNPVNFNGFACSISRGVLGECPGVMSENDAFVSSTGNFNINTLDHMKKLVDLLSLRTPDTLTTIDLAGSQGLEGMKVDTVKPQKIVFVFPIGHGVIVFMCAKIRPVGHPTALEVMWCGTSPARTQQCS